MNRLLPVLGWQTPQVVRWRWWAALSYLYVRTAKPIFPDNRYWKKTA